MVWACPHCKEQLSLVDQTWACCNQHVFDVAREGYVNLLPAHGKRSKTPGDSADMIAARRRIHDNQLYRPLANELAETVVPRKTIKRILDLGCGEGYYNGELAKAIPDGEFYGIDISKTAVRLAAKKYRGHQYAVASSSHIPVADSSFDMALSIFAPVSERELIRLLSSSGFFLEVGPSRKHLWEIRETLYDTPKEHRDMRREIEQFERVDEGELDYMQTLDQQQIGDLLMATPFAFRGHREKRTALQQHAGLTVTMAFQWRLYQLINMDPASKPS